MNWRIVIENLVIIIIIYYLLELLVMLGITGARSPLTAVIQALMLFGLFLVARSVIYRFLPAHLAAGSLVWSVNGERSVKAVSTSCFTVKQAPPQQLKDFFISLGRHDYAIWERSGQTLLAFYPDREGKDRSLATGAGVKDMLVRVFPGLELEEAGLVNMLGLPVVDEAKAWESYGPAGGEGSLFPGGQEPAMINSDGVAGHQAEASREGTAPVQVVNDEPPVLLFDTGLLQPLTGYFRTENTDEGQWFVTGALIGPASGQGQDIKVESYVLFPGAGKIDFLEKRIADLQADLDRQQVVNNTGERVAVNALFAGLKDAGEQVTAGLARELLKEFVTSGQELPLVVLDVAEMDLEAFTATSNGRTVERNGEGMNGEQSLEKMFIRLVK